MGKSEKSLKGPNKSQQRANPTTTTKLLLSLYQPGQPLSTAMPRRERARQVLYLSEHRRPRLVRVRRLVATRAKVASTCPIDLLLIFQAGLTCRFPDTMQSAILTHSNVAMIAVSLGNPATPGALVIHGKLPEMAVKQGNTVTLEKVGLPTLSGMRGLENMSIAERQIPLVMPIAQSSCHVTAATKRIEPIAMDAVADLMILQATRQHHRISRQLQQAKNPP